MDSPEFNSEFYIPDIPGASPRLMELVRTLSELNRLTITISRAKREGLAVEEYDQFLVKSQEWADKIVAAMNEEFKKREDYK